MICHWPAGGPTSPHTRMLLTLESLVLTTVSPAWLGSPEQGRLSGPRFPFVPLGHAEAVSPGFGLTLQPHALAQLATDGPPAALLGARDGVCRGASARSTIGSLSRSSAPVQSLSSLHALRGALGHGVASTTR